VFRAPNAEIDNRCCYLSRHEFDAPLLIFEPLYERVQLARR
jgi:hypothetical protein